MRKATLKKSLVRRDNTVKFRESLHEGARPDNGPTVEEFSMEELPEWERELLSEDTLVKPEEKAITAPPVAREVFRAKNAVEQEIYEQNQRRKAATRKDVRSCMKQRYGVLL